MKVACIVLAHHRPRQLARLLSVLRHAQIQVYLHVNRRARFAPFREALVDLRVPAPTILRRRATRWGRAELIDATLEGIQRGVADRCHYFLLISGQDFPLRSSDEIVTFAETAQSRSCMAHWPLPTDRWRFGGRDRTDFYTYNVFGRVETCIPRGEDVSFLNWRGRTLNEVLRLRTAFEPRRCFPPYLQPFGGWTWWNLSRPAADHVLSFVDEHPDYRRYHEHTFAPDEIFFQSVLLGTDFARHQEVVDDSLRFTIWPENATHPRILTLDDMPEMVASHCLFARKFDSVVDDAVLAELAARVTA